MSDDDKPVNSNDSADVEKQEQDTWTEATETKNEEAVVANSATETQTISAKAKDAKVESAKAKDAKAKDVKAKDAKAKDEPEPKI